MFGLGAREAVLAAVEAGDVRGFGAPAPVPTVAAALRGVLGGHAELRLEDDRLEVRFAPGLDPRTAGRLEVQAEVVLRAPAWDTRTGDGGVVARPATP